MNHHETERSEFADVSVQRLARVYAEALYRAAEAEGQLPPVIAELDSLVDDVFRAEPRLEVLMSSAAVGRTVRRQAIEKAFQGRATDVLYRFLLVLNDHERLGLARPIRRALHDLDDARHQRVKVHVTSAVPLSDHARDEVSASIRHRFNVEPIIVSHVDPSILGGLKVRMGDRQLDSSVRTRIDNLRDQILARSRHEIQTGRDRFSTDA